MIHIYYRALMTGYRAVKSLCSDSIPSIVPVLTPIVPLQAVGASVLRPPIDLTSDEPASGGNQPAPASGGNDRPGLPWQDPQTALSGWHRGSLLVDTDSVLAVPQSVHEPARGVATDSRVHYTPASGGHEFARASGRTEPASGGNEFALASGGTEPASGGNDGPGPWTAWYAPGWHGSAVATDSVLAVPQFVHKPDRGMATYDAVGHQSEAAVTRPASPQPLASGSPCGSFEEVALPTTSDIVDVQAEVDAEAAGEQAPTSSAAPWPWPMDRRIDQ